MLIPEGFTTVFPYIFAEDANAYLDFLRDGLGGEIVAVHRADDGAVANAHVRFGTMTLMVSEAREGLRKTQGSFYIYVKDADAPWRAASPPAARNARPSRPCPMATARADSSIRRAISGGSRSTCRTRLTDCPGLPFSTARGTTVTPSPLDPSQRVRKGRSRIAGRRPPGSAL